MNNNEDFSGITFEDGDLSGSKVNPLDILRIEKKLDELGELVDLSFKNGASTRGTDYAEIALSYYDESIKELNLLENLAGKDSESYKSNSRKVSFKLLECAVRAGSSHPKYNEINDLAKRISPAFGSSDDFINYIKELSKKIDRLKNEGALKEKKTVVSQTQVSSHEDSKSVPEANKRGLIKRYYEDSGYGVILDEFDEEIFFDREDVSEFSENVPFEGCSAVFALTYTPFDDVKACNVKIFPTEKPLYKVADDFFIIKEGRRIPHGYVLIDEFPWEIENICVDKSNSDRIFRSRLKEIGANAVINVTRKLSTSTERKFGGGTKYSTLYNIKGTVARIGELSLSGVELTDLPDLNKKCESKYKSLKRAYPCAILIKLALFLSVSGLFAYIGIIHLAVFVLAFGAFNTLKTKKKRVWISKKE